MGIDERGVIMSYKLAGVIWNDDGNLAIPDTHTITKIQSSVSNIHISDSIENIHVYYKGKEYKFNLEKVLNLLADIVEEREK